MLSLLLEVAAEAAPKVTAQRSTDQSSETTQPDWLLYLLTIAAIASGIHFFRSFSQKLAHPPPPPPSRPSPVPTSASAMASSAHGSADKAWTLSELAAYNGTDASKPLLMGCAGHVFDVTSGADFYGPGGPYGVFAGKDASRGLARMEIEYKSQRGAADISDLTGSQQTTLQEWHDKFESKYPLMGNIVDSSEPNSGSAQAAGGNSSGGAAGSSSEGAGATTTDGAAGQTANPLVQSAPGV